MPASPNIEPRKDIREGIPAMRIELLYNHDLAVISPHISNKELLKFRDPLDDMVVFEVGNVDDTYQAFLEKGINFINEPTDMPDWGMRVVHLRDLEENLIEFITPLASR